MGDTKQIAGQMWPLGHSLWTPDLRGHTNLASSCFSDLSHHFSRPRPGAASLISAILSLALFPGTGPLRFLNLVTSSQGPFLLVIAKRTSSFLLPHPGILLCFIS